MVVTADTISPSRAIAGGAKLSRGLLASALSVGSAAVSHTVAGHHGPHWVVLILALAISIPVSSALSSVQLSKKRLGAAVLFSQGVFHSLFAFFPSAGGAASSTVHGDAATHAGHAVHDQSIAVTAAAQTNTVAHVMPDAAMLVAHLAAAVFSFAVFHRGEVILHALGILLLLSPVLVLFFRSVALTGPRVVGAHESYRTTIVGDLWLGAGAQTLRGPPVVLVN